MSVRMTELPRPSLGISSPAAGMPSTANRADNLQRMLDMEARAKLLKLGIGSVGGSTPVLPTFATPKLDPVPTLQERRRDSLTRTDESDPMLKSFRRSLTAPSLSINIPPPRDSLAVGRASGAVASANDGGESASENSSICGSPSWEGFGRKKGKKDKKKKKKKNRVTMDVSILRKDKNKRKEQEPGSVPSAKLTKAGGRHHSMQLPTPPVPPVPLTSPWTASPGDVHGHGGIVKTTDLQVNSRPQQGAGGGPGSYGSTPAAEGAVSGAAMPAGGEPGGGSGFVGGIRLEKEKQAAARAANGSHTHSRSHSRARSHSRSGSLSVFPSTRSATSPTMAKPEEQPVFPGPRPQLNSPPSQMQPKGPGAADMPSTPQHKTTQSSSEAAITHASGRLGLQALGAHGRSHSLFSATASKLFQKQRASKADQSTSTPHASGASHPHSHPHPQPTPGNGPQGYFPPVQATNYIPGPHPAPAPTQKFQRTLSWQPQPDAASPGHGSSLFNIQAASAHHQGPSAAAHSPTAPGQSPQPITIGPARNGARDSSDPAATATTTGGRSFKDKAKAMLNRASILPPGNVVQDCPPTQPSPVITGPFNARGTGPHFHLTAEDHSSDSAPSSYGPQTSGGSSTSSFDDAYISSPATTPDTSRPQSSKDTHTPAVVGEVAQGTAHDPILPHDTRAFRTSQSGVIVMGKSAGARPVRPRRSSSNYSQQSPARNSYQPEQTPGSSFVPAAGATDSNTFIVDFDAGCSITDSSLFTPASGHAGTQQTGAGSVAPALATDEAAEAATWQSIIPFSDPEASDVQGANEESDDSGRRVSTSFLPPLKHEPFIPPKSRARKSRAPPRAVSFGGGGTRSIHAEAAEQLDVVSGAAYLKEARKSINVPSSKLKPSTLRMSIGLPPAIPRESILRGQQQQQQQQQQAQALPIVIPGAQSLVQPQEQKQAVTVSRRSLVPPPPAAVAAVASSRPGSKFWVSPKDGGSAGGSAGPGPKQQLAKMLVQCCGCEFFQDMPSRVYECMANPDAVVEDHAIGISGAITTSVKCCWCAHNMSTSCCRGYAAIIHLKERLH